MACQPLYQCTTKRYYSYYFVDYVCESCVYCTLMCIEHTALTVVVLTVGSHYEGDEQRK